MRLLLACACVSAAIHAAAIVGASFPGVWRGNDAMPTAPAIHVRLVTAGGVRSSEPERTRSNHLMPAGAPHPAATITAHATERNRSDESFGLGTTHPYYRSSELDERPSALTDIEPDLAVPGAYVVLRLRINERGDVDEVKPVIGEEQAAVESAVTAFKSARFSPGRRQGLPVKSEMWVELKFHAIDPAMPLPPTGTAE